MNIKRSLITTLPPFVKRILATPYDLYQTRTANREFAAKEFPDVTASETRPQHIVCVVVDALRADAIDSEKTPFLDSLSGTRDAITPGLWTFPAVSSILTGRYPHEHGAMRQSDEYYDSGLRLPPKLPPERTTLTEVLAGAGYETYGGFGHDTPFVALSGRFHEHALFHKVNSTAQDVLEDYLDWVGNRRNEPTFAFIHLADPHIPVDPPEEYWDRHDVADLPNIRNWDYQDDIECNSTCEEYRQQRRALYDASIDYVDDVLADFHDQLDELDDVRLLLTSDHGEALWENVEYDVEHFDGTGCVDHGGAPYESLARVPLLTDGIEVEAGGLVSLVDIVPTILAMTGLEGSLESSGIPLDESKDDGRTVVVEGSLSGHEKKGVYRCPDGDAGWKLVASEGHSVTETWSLPDETPKDAPDAIRNGLEDAMPPFPGGSEERTDVSQVTEDRLEHLGYK